MSVPLQRGGGRPGPPALLALPRTARFVAERWNRLREWGANDIATVERHTSMAVNPVDWCREVTAGAARRMHPHTLITDRPPARLVAVA